MFTKVVAVLLVSAVLAQDTPVETGELEIEQGYVVCTVCSASPDEPGAEYCPPEGFERQENTTEKRCGGGACVKIIQYLPQGAKTDRRCIAESEIESLFTLQGCKEDQVPYVVTNSNINVKTCVCHNDNCNAATGLLAAPLVVGLVSIISRILA